MPLPSGPARSGILEFAGGEDDRGGKQEGEPGGVLVGQAAGQVAEGPGQSLVGSAVRGVLMLAVGVVARDLFRGVAGDAVNGRGGRRR